MNLRLLVCIGMGLFTTYMGLVMLIARFRQPPPLALPPKPNFSAVSQQILDPVTGEKAEYREITVTTRLANGAPAPGVESASQPPAAR